MKPKEWLLKNGHIKEIGRGRMSREHISLIEKAVKDNPNLVIEGYSNYTVPKSIVSEAKTTVKTEKPEFVGIADVPDPRRDERTVEAYTYSDGNKVPVGMRTVCNICKCSLNYCPCETPRVWVDHEHEGVVLFATRKQPTNVMWY